jgi:hypothetical protein
LGLWPKAVGAPAPTKVEVGRGALPVTTPIRLAQGGVVQVGACRIHIVYTVKRCDHSHTQ